MSKITVSPATGTWSVRGADGVLVESRNAQSLVEGGRDPVIYFPRADIAMALLEPSDTTSTCPHKGKAKYFSLVGASERIADVAWAYDEVTNPDAKAIEGHLAFYEGKVTVEQL